MLARRVEEYFRDRMVGNYDRCMGPLERRLFGEARARLAARTFGLVLDVGAGTGANFAHYSEAARAVVAVDPELRMLAAARARAASARPPVRLVAASAEELPFRSASFDSAVATLVFCTIPDPARAIAEIERVLAPGGRLLMLEHVRSHTPLVAVLQDAATPLQRLVAAGCHLNRRTQSLVARSGFRVDALRERFRGTIVELEATRAA